MYCTKYYGMLFWILFYGRIGRIRPLIEAQPQARSDALMRLAMGMLVSLEDPALAWTPQAGGPSIDMQHSWSFLSH